MVRASDLRLNRSWVRLPAIPRSYNNFGQVVHTRVPLSTNSKFGTSQRAVMPCGGKGNCRSGVTPAMHHRLLWFIRLRVLSLRKKDEQLSALPTCLCQLHWLPVQRRVEFQIACLAHQSIMSTAPTLTEHSLFHAHVPLSVTEVFLSQDHMCGTVYRLL